MNAPSQPRQHFYPSRAQPTSSAASSPCPPWPSCPCLPCWIPGQGCSTAVQVQQYPVQPGAPGLYPGASPTEFGIYAGAYYPAQGVQRFPICVARPPAPPSRGAGHWGRSLGKPFPPWAPDLGLLDAWVQVSGFSCGRCLGCSQKMGRALGDQDCITNPRKSGVPFLAQGRQPMCPSPAASLCGRGEWGPEGVRILLPQPPLQPARMASVGWTAGTTPGALAPTLSHASDACESDF